MQKETVPIYNYNSEHIGHYEPSTKTYFVYFNYEIKLEVFRRYDVETVVLKFKHEPDIILKNISLNSNLIE
jgi:hypothetical protein